MDKYKSWSWLNKQLCLRLCDKLQGRISYFLTRYHDVHNAYGRAAILLDRKEIASFSWIEMYHQEFDISKNFKDDNTTSYREMEAKLKPKWDENCNYSEMDFLDAALRYRNMTIKTALNSEDYIIKIFAVMDRRIGKRTLLKIQNAYEYEKYPAWVQQFYKLRLSELQ